MAARTGAKSAAVKSLSHAHPIDRLHTAPGNWRSAVSNNPAIFSKLASPSSVGVALKTTSCAAGAIACATSRSIVVSPFGLPGEPPIRIGWKGGRSDMSEKVSRSLCTKPSNSKNTIVMPWPVNPVEASRPAL
jgi:hypothetical protein